VGLLLDGGQKGLVDGLLVLDAVLGGLLLLLRLLVSSHKTLVAVTHLGLLALLEESVLARLVGSLVLGEVAVLAGLLDNLLIYACKVDLGGGSNDIAGVYSAEGNTVNFEGTGNKEDTLGKVLEDNDALAAEATSKEDDDGTGLKGLANLCRADSLAGLWSQLAELQKMLYSPKFHNGAPAACWHIESFPASMQSSSLLARSRLSQTYLLGDGDVLSRVVLAGLLAVVRYRPLPLGELLGGGLRVLLCGRHFVSLWSLVLVGGVGDGRIFVKSSVCQAVQSIRVTGPSIIPGRSEFPAALPPAPPRKLEHHCPSITNITQTCRFSH
jgi:hypothetical protein